MPQKYVRDMRTAGHADEVIKQAMVEVGWQPAQVEELFMSLWHLDAADLEAVAAEEQAAPENQFNLSYPRSPWDLITAIKLFVQAHPRLIVLSALAALVAIMAGLLSAMATQRVLKEFPSIALFGEEFAEPLTAITYTLLLLVALWIPFGLAVNGLRFVGLKANILVLTSRQLSPQSIKNHLARPLLRHLGVQTILYAKLVVIYCSFTGLSLIIHADLLPFMQTTALLLMVAVFLHNSLLLPLTLTDQSLSELGASKVATERLRSSQRKWLDTAGWLGLSLLIGLLTYLLSSGIFNLSSAVTLTRISWLSVTALSLAVSSFFIVFDTGLMRIFLASPDQHRPKRTATALNAVLAVVGIVGILLIVG